MSNAEKIAPVLNLAKLVRLQQTNQARRGPVYDASLYIFPHNDLMSPEVVLRNQTANDIRLMLENFPLTHFVSHYFYQFVALVIEV